MTLNSQWMRRFVAAVLATALSWFAYAQVDDMTAVTLIQHARSPNSVAGATGNPYHFYLPNGSLSGNGLVLLVQASTTATEFTIADDQGNTWTAGPSSAVGTRIAAFFVLNAIANTRHIQVSFTGTDPTFFQMAVAEFAGLASSGSSTNAPGATGQVTSVPAGSFTPASTGDLIIQYGADVDAVPAIEITGYTKGSGFTKLTLNRIDGDFVQYRTAPGGAINPTFTIDGSTDHFDTLAFSLPADATKGTLASATAMRVVAVHSFAIGPANANTSIAFDVPVVGNLLISQSIMFSATGTEPDISGITDSRAGSPTYAQAGLPVNNPGTGQDSVQTFYAAGGPADSENVVTITLVAAQTDGSSIVFLDVVNAPASPFDAEGHDIGTQSVTGDLTTSSVMASTANGLVVAHVSINLHTTNGVNSPWLFEATTNPSMDGGSNAISEDNGWAHLYNAAAGVQTPVWNIQNSPDGVGTWAAKAVAFKGPAVDDPDSAVGH
jgi:hypothetical protein